MMYRQVLTRCGAASAILGCLLATAHAQSRPPDLVPHGWRTQSVEGRRDVIRYVSPDGQAVLTLRDISRGGASVREEFATFADRAPGPITYKRLADSWFVLSGYRESKIIYYTRVDLACGGRRWHIAELTYPREQKTMRDAAVEHASSALRKYRNVCPKNR
jgi:hypothetical protein